MEQIETRGRGFGLRLLGATVAPFVVATAYLFFTRWPSYRFTTFSDYAALAVSVLAGAVFVAVLPIRPHQRVLSLFFTAVPEDLKKWAGTFCLHLPHGRDESTQNCPSPLPVQHPATDLQFYSPALGL